MARAPSVFVSYSWDDQAHKEWVRALATRLRADGIEVTLDQWHAVPGEQLPRFMESAVREADFVLLICTPAYKAKADGGRGGVGYEGDVMSGEVFTGQHQTKFIPVLRRGEWREAAPASALGKYYIDLTANPYSEDAYTDLVLTLHKRRQSAPPIGSGTSEASPSDAAVELAVLMDLLATQVQEMQHVAYTFGESRRVLSFAHRLHKQLKSRIAGSEGFLTSPATLAALDRLHDVTGTFLSEANYVLPTSKDDGYTASTDGLKQHRYRVLAEWDALKPHLLTGVSQRAAFERLRNEGDTLWRMVGYANRAEFDAYVSPRTVDLFRTAGPTETALLSVLVDSRDFSSASLIDEGFPKLTVVEVVNSLMRDEYVKTDDWKVFRMTPVGARILKMLLAKASKRQ